MFRLEVEYDARGRVKRIESLIGRSTGAISYAYNVDGHLVEATGTGGSWRYVLLAV